MYCSHFNLKKKPFQLSSDNSFLWLGNTHARALGLLQRGINGPQRTLVLTGDIGTGKTTLIHELLDGLPPETAIAHITDPSLELHYLFLSIAQGLGFDSLYQEGEKFAPILSAFLERKRQQGEKCLIIIDEVHLIPDRFLDQLLSWSQAAPDNTLTFILAGQLEFHEVIEKKLGQSWRSKVDINTMLAPLDENETRDYINRRLELAGASHKIFLLPAIREVHHFSKGIPRRINIACDQAMIAAYANEMKTVDAQTFQEAVGILKLPEAPKRVSTPRPIVRDSQPSQPVPKTRKLSKAFAGLAAALILGVLTYTFYPRPVSAPTQPPAAKQEPLTTQTTAPAPVPQPQIPEQAAAPESENIGNASLASTPAPAPDTSHIALPEKPAQALSASPVSTDPEELTQVVAPLAIPPLEETLRSEEAAPPQPQSLTDADIEAYEPPVTEKTPQFPVPEQPPIPPEPLVSEPAGPANVDEFIKEVFMINKAASMAKIPESTLRTSPPPQKTVTALETPRPQPKPVAETTSIAAPEKTSKPDSPPPIASPPDHDAIIDWLIRKKAE